MNIIHVFDYFTKMSAKATKLDLVDFHYFVSETCMYKSPRLADDNIDCGIRSCVRACVRAPPRVCVCAM